MRRTLFEAQVVNVNNYYQQTVNNYLEVIKTIGSISKKSVSLFGHNEELIYFNNRIGSLNGVNQNELTNLSMVACYIRHNYVDFEHVYNAIVKSYQDRTRRRRVASLISRQCVVFDIIPVVDKNNQTLMLILGDVCSCFGGKNDMTKPRFSCGFDHGFDQDRISY